MNLNELIFDKQVGYLRSLMGSGKNSLTGYMALFAFRHHLALKHSPRFSQKPLLRWYLGQLAKEYISKYYKEARTNLDNFARIGLIEVRSGATEVSDEYHLNEAVYPALLDVLKEIFGEECISNAISRAKFYKDPEPKGTMRLDDGFSEVKE